MTWPGGLKYKPKDPDLDQAASWHSYYFNNIGC